MSAATATYQSGKAHYFISRSVYEWKLLWEQNLNMVKTLDMVTFTRRRCSRPGCSDHNRTQGERNSREIAEAQVIASPPELQHSDLFQSEQTNISLVRVLKQHIPPTTLLQPSFSSQFGTIITERKKIYRNGRRDHRRADSGFLHKHKGAEEAEHL